MKLFHDDPNPAVVSRITSFELLDGRGDVVETRPALLCAGGAYLELKAPTALDRAWTVRAVDALGRTVDERRTPLGHVMLRMLEPQEQEG